MNLVQLKRSDTGDECRDAVDTAEQEEACLGREEAPPCETHLRSTKMATLDITGQSKVDVGQNPQVMKVLSTSENLENFMCKWRIRKQKMLSLQLAFLCTSRVTRSRWPRNEL